MSPLQVQQGREQQHGHPRCHNPQQPHQRDSNLRLWWPSEGAWPKARRWHAMQRHDTSLPATSRLASQTSRRSRKAASAAEDELRYVERAIAGQVADQRKSDEDPHETYQDGWPAHDSRSISPGEKKHNH